MHIRKARNRDLPALVQMERQGAELYYQIGFSREELGPRTEGDLRFLLTHTTMKVAVDLSDHPLGYISYYPIESYLHLEEHTVHSDVHHQGIGEALLLHYFTAGREMNRCEHYSLFCFTAAEWAYQMYCKHGFTRVEPWQIVDLKSDVYKHMLASEIRQQYSQNRVLLVKECSS